MDEPILRREDHSAQIEAEHQSLLPDDWQDEDALWDDIQSEVWLRRLYDSTRPQRDEEEPCK